EFEIAATLAREHQRRSGGRGVILQEAERSKAADPKQARSVPSSAPARDAFEIVEIRQEEGVSAVRRLEEPLQGQAIGRDREVQLVLLEKEQLAKQRDRLRLHLQEPDLRVGPNQEVNLGKGAKQLLHGVVRDPRRFEKAVGEVWPGSDRRMNILGLGSR